MRAEKLSEPNVSEVLGTSNCASAEIQPLCGDSLESDSMSRAALTAIERQRVRNIALQQSHYTKSETSKDSVSACQTSKLFLQIKINFQIVDALKNSLELR